MKSIWWKTRNSHCHRMRSLGLSDVLGAGLRFQDCIADFRPAYVKLLLACNIYNTYLHIHNKTNKLSSPWFSIKWFTLFSKLKIELNSNLCVTCLCWSLAPKSFHLQNHHPYHLHNALADQVHWSHKSFDEKQNVNNAYHNKTVYHNTAVIMLNNIFIINIVIIRNA